MAEGQTRVFQEADHQGGELIPPFYFSTRKLPRSSASMPELKNVRMASVGRVHDGFTAQVEGRVHDDGHAGALAEFVDQAVVERIDSFSTVCGRALPST